MKNIIKLFTLLATIGFACGVAYAAGGNNGNNNNKTYYSKLVLGLAKDMDSTAGGTVAIGTSSYSADSYGTTAEKTQSGQGTGGGFPGQQSSGKSFTYYAYAKANTGYVFTGWSTDASSSSIVSTDSPYTFTHTATATSSGSPTTGYLYAHFEKLEYGAVLTAQVASDSTGLGTVNASTTTTAGTYGTTSSSPAIISTTSGASVTGYAFAQAASGYVFTGWSTTDAGTVVSTASPYAATITAATVNGSTNTTIYYAHFGEVVCRLTSNNKEYTSLAAAYADATATDTIVLLKDKLSFDAGMTIAKNITLTSETDKTYTLVRGADVAFAVSGSLTLSNIVLDGAGVSATSALVTVADGGTFTLTDGATIENGKNASGKGGAVYAAGGATVNLTGGTITGCSAAEGGAVYLEGASSGTTTQNYTYFRFTFKAPYATDNWGFTIVQLSELSLYDASGDRINSGTYTEIADNTDPSSLQTNQVVFGMNNTTSTAYYKTGEPPSNLFDASTSTKFCLQGDSYKTMSASDASTWFTISFRVPDGTAAAASYSFTSASDCTPARNPAIWTVEGSVDGTTWVTLDSQSGQGATPSSTTTEGSKYAITGTKTTTTQTAAATLNVSGNPTVADNTVAGSTALSNIQPTTNAQVTLAGDFTGTVGVNWPSSGTSSAAAGQVFGVASLGSSATGFFWDGDKDALQAKISNGTLVWETKTPHYDGTKTIAEILEETEGSDPVTIEISTSVASDDIVIPAGRDVIIDLKGATLTANIVANGKVTITDSTEDKTGSLVGTVSKGDSGTVLIEWGTYSTRPDESWLAEGRIIVENDDGTFTVTEFVESSAVTECTLDTRRGVRVVENPYADVLPLTYASGNWVSYASTNQTRKSTVTVAAALPQGGVTEFASAQWHDGMTNNVAATGDNSYDYPSGNFDIVTTSALQTLYAGPNESEVVWQEDREGLVEAKIVNEEGTIRAWYKFPDLITNIIPVLPGDATKTQDPDYVDPDDMNTPGDADYPGYSVTNDVTNPWVVALDPVNPYTTDPTDATKVVTNYVAQTPNVPDPANTAMQVVLTAVGPGTLTWKDLIVDGSAENDSTITVSIDGGDPITIHTGGMDDWANQAVVFGGDTDTQHTVVITFQGNSSGDTANQAHGYVDGVVWTPDTPAAKSDVKATDSEDFTFANLGTEPTAETSGVTTFYPNGTTNGTDLATVSTVDASGKQLTSTAGKEDTVSDTSTGTEDYWYAVSDPGADNVTGNTIAQTASTLSAGEATTMTVTGLTGPVKVSWDMLIDDPSSDADSKLLVVVTKHTTDADGNDVATVTTNTYTAAEIADWTDGYLALGGPSSYATNGVYASEATYDVAFTFVNNSDGTATGSLDNIKVVHPDLNIAPEVNDGTTHAAAGSSYTGEVNSSTDASYPGYTATNDRDNPWEVVTDPKAGTSGASGTTGSTQTTDKVAATPDSLAPGESTTLTFTVNGDGEFSFKSLVDTTTGEGKTPASITVIVDGVTNQVYGAESDWTEHVVHVTDADGSDGATHTIEIVYTQDGDDASSTGYLDNVEWTPSATQEQMLAVVDTDPPSTTVDELQQRVAITNSATSGWMPSYGVDTNGNTVVTGVRSPDGTEGTGDDADLDSTFTIGITGTGEIKIESITVPVAGDETDPDDGALTITVDGTVYKIPPTSDDNVSYSITTNNGVVVISNLVIQVTGEPTTPHAVTFEYTRDANDAAANTAAVVEHITWKTYGESDKGGTSWLEGKALWIIDHEDPGDGYVYLAFEPELKVVDELVTWANRSDTNDMIRVKYGQTRAAADACEPVIAHLSAKHAITPVKVWIKVSLDDLNKVTVVKPVGYWRIYIDGPAIRLSGTGSSGSSSSSGASLQDAAVPSAADASDIVGTGAVSVNTFGILKIESTTTNTMIAIPWTWYSKDEAEAEDIPARKLVKTTNLTEGDLLYGWIPSEAKYAAWTVNADRDWEPVSKVMVDALGNSSVTKADDDDPSDTTFEGATRVARGGGLWLVRQNPFTVAADGTTNAVPFWVYGQSVTTEVATVVSAPTGTMTVCSTMLGSPYAKEVRINDLAFEGTIASNDRIWVPNGTTTPKYLIYVSGKGWRYTYTTLVNGRRKTVLDYDTTVPAGQAFWYDRRGATDLRVVWPK